jgi:hypothetical protein
MNNYERLAEFFNSQDVPEQQAIDEYKHSLEDDMAAHLKDMVQHGWMEQDEAEDNLLAFHRALYGIPEDNAA